MRQQPASPSGLVVCVCACVRAYMFVCVLLLFFKCVYVTGEGLGPVEVSGSCLCWSEIPKSNKY